jgi:lipopolysaccharide export system ATP-binding protein
MEKPALCRLTISDLSVGRRHPIISHTSHSFGAGHYLLFGPNGSGKSTFFFTLSGHLPAHTGSIVVDGVTLAQLPLRERCRHIGLFPQDPSFGHFFSVKEYLSAQVEMGLSTLSDLTASIEEWNLENLLEKHPYTLSGGEQTRVHLARFFSIARKIFLLDEPFSNLDFSFQQRLERKISTLVHGGATVMTIQHAPSVHLGLYQAILVLRDQKISAIATGDTEHLLRELSAAFGIAFTVKNDWLLPA